RPARYPRPAPAPDGRCPQSRQSATRMPVPHPLSEGAAAVLTRGAAARGQGRRDHRRVPLSAKPQRGGRAGPGRDGSGLLFLDVKRLARQLLAAPGPQLYFEEVVAVVI